MNSQILFITDLVHRKWNIKYLPENFRAEDINDKIHPYYNLLQDFDKLRDIIFTLDDIDIRILNNLEIKLKQIGKIIDKLIDVKGPFVKGIFDFTALAAYVHTLNDLWFKKTQLIIARKFSTYEYNKIIDGILYSFDIWLGEPQFDFWDEKFQSQLEANVYWCKFKI